MILSRNKQKLYFNKGKFFIESIDSLLEKFQLINRF